MSKTIIGAMPIRTVGLTPGHRWCGELRSVKPAVNNGKGARGLVQGLNSLNATYIRQGRIRDRPRKLAKDLRNGHLENRLLALNRGDNLDLGSSVLVPTLQGVAMEMGRTRWSDCRWPGAT